MSDTVMDPPAPPATATPNGDAADAADTVVHLREAASMAAEHVSAWYGQHKALEDITLDMPANSVTALIGPSGCGKSTFIRILNRMHELIPGASLAGEVLLDGKDIYGPEQRPTETRRKIGMVFQKPNPFPAMTVLRERPVRTEALRPARAQARRPGRGVPAQGRAVERGQDPAPAGGRRAVGRPAAAAVHRARPGRAARRCC